MALQNISFALEGLRERSAVCWWLSVWTQWTFSSPYRKKDQPSSMAPPLLPRRPSPSSLHSADSAVRNGDESDIFLSVCTQLTLSAEQHLWLMETNLQEQQRNNNQLDYQIYGRDRAIPIGLNPRKTQLNGGMQDGRETKVTPQGEIHSFYRNSGRSSDIIKKQCPCIQPGPEQSKIKLVVRWYSELLFIKLTVIRPGHQV